MDDATIKHCITRTQGKKWVRRADYVRIVLPHKVAKKGKGKKAVATADAEDERVVKLLDKYGVDRKCAEGLTLSKLQFVATATLELSWGMARKDAENLIREVRDALRRLPADVVVLQDGRETERAQKAAPRERSTQESASSGAGKPRNIGLNVTLAKGEKKPKPGTVCVLEFVPGARVRLRTAPVYAVVAYTKMELIIDEQLRVNESEALNLLRLRSEQDLPFATIIYAGDCTVHAAGARNGQLLAGHDERFIGFAVDNAESDGFVRARVRLTAADGGLLRLEELSQLVAP
jgi:hypothetical protein